MMAAKRGALIVIEGCDRSGKTTQGTKLVQHLVGKLGLKAVLQKFPERSTAIGQAINSYLIGEQQLDDRVIHLLYSANRWEYFSRMKEQLLSGTDIIVDRYAFSGVAFSSAKEGMDLKWCCNSDIGLLKPDAVLFFDMPLESAEKRSGFGNERYETLTFQTKVYEIYKTMGAINSDIWKNVNADRSIEDVHKDVVDTILPIIEHARSQPLQHLWTNNELELINKHYKGA